MKLLGYLLVLAAIAVIIKWVVLGALVALPIVAVVALVRRHRATSRKREDVPPERFTVTDGTCSCGLPERIHILTDGEVDVTRFHAG